jgi:hypothetical protein
MCDFQLKSHICSRPPDCFEEGSSVMLSLTELKTAHHCFPPPHLPITTVHGVGGMAEATYIRSSSRADMVALSPLDRCRESGQLLLLLVIINTARSPSQRASIANRRWEASLLLFMGLSARPICCSGLELPLTGHCAPQKLVQRSMQPLSENGLVAPERGHHA